MSRLVRGALGALLAVAVALAVSAPASAGKSGSQTFNGVIVASNLSGSRTVLSSVVVGRGVFRGVGRIVEIDSLPGDPENVLRDDLVFAEGTLHIVSTSLSASFDLNPRTCIGSFKAQQTTTIEGGTGRFGHATGSFAGTVSGRGLVGRNPDGTCAQEQAPLIEVDTVTASGTLSF
jgi:hypothetical protein